MRSPHPFPLSVRLILVFAVILFFGYPAQAQNPDSTALADLYDAFSSTVRRYDGDAHLPLYVHPHAPVHVIIESAGVPVITGARDATEWVEVFTSGPNNLTISNIDWEIHGGIASSVADYRGHGTGLDLFGYVRTTEGWKLLLLHATGDPIFGNANLPNTIDDVLSSLNTTVTAANRDAFIDRFALTSSPFLTLESNLSEDYSFNKHTVEGYLRMLDGDASSLTIELSNEDIRVEDAYTARVWADYQISRDNTLLESGRALIFMFATGTKGWQVSAFVGAKQQTTSAQTEEPLPDAMILRQNYPNPFSPSTEISYRLEHEAPITLRVFNMLGQVVRTLVAQRKPAGEHTISWDARDENGESVSPGVYIYRISDGHQMLTKRMVLLR